MQGHLQGNWDPAQSDCLESPLPSVQLLEESCPSSGQGGGMKERESLVSPSFGPLSPSRTSYLLSPAIGCRKLSSQEPGKLSSQSASLCTQRARAGQGRICGQWAQGWQAPSPPFMHSKNPKVSMNSHETCTALNSLHRIC